MEVNKVEENVSFSVEMIWKSYRKEKECSWKAGVEQYYEGSSKVAKKLSVRTYDNGETVITTFQKYLSKLIYFANSNSTVLSAKSAEILEALSKLNRLNISPTKILKESERAVPQLIEDYTKIVSSLSIFIGELTCPVNDALINLLSSIAHFIKEFFNNSILGFKRKIDFQPVIAHAQVFINTIALISKTALDKCDLSTPHVYDALTVLSLILIHLLLSIQGVNICTQEILYSRSRIIPVVLHVCSLPILNFAKDITHAVFSIKLPLTDSIKTILTKLVNLTILINSILSEQFGSLKGVAITVAQITQSLSKNLFRITNDSN